MKLQHKIFLKISLTVLSAAAMLIIAAQTGFCVPDAASLPVQQTTQEAVQTNSTTNQSTLQKPAQTNPDAAAKTEPSDTDKAQQEKKDTILKFIIAMAGVLLSSIIIFLGLTIYNKFFVNKNMFADNNSDDVLNTPKTVEEAVTFYIKRNKLC